MILRSVMPPLIGDASAFGGASRQFPFELQLAVAKVVDHGTPPSPLGSWGSGPRSLSVFLEIRTLGRSWDAGGPRDDKNPTIRLWRHPVAGRGTR